MKKGAKGLEKITGRLGIDMIMETVSNREISVDGCRGVTEYDNTFIKLNAGHGTVTVTGQNLEIISFNEQSLMIKGKIERIDFCM